MIPMVTVDKTAVDWTTRSKRYVNPGELETLITLAASVKPRCVIEFGINNGRTAQALIEYVHGIALYVGIDVPVGYRTEKLVQRQEVPQVPGELVLDDNRVQLIVREGGSQSLHAGELPYADFVFIDGDHSRAGVENDTMLALQRTRPGGMIVWHDYHDLGTVDVREVLNEKFQKGWDLRHAKGTRIVYMRV